MARISEDDTSWKAGGIKRRDFRSIKNGPEVPKQGKKKDTKKWCKGVVGREHDLDIAVAAMKYERYYRDMGIKPRWVHDECKTCGKSFRFRRNPDL